jgi:16S rRNA (cytosine1402-N4)-methyltransferase
MIFHQPVLLVEVLGYMNVARDRGYFCDCTTGGAGHLLAMLQKTQKAKFLGIEWDGDAISYAKNRIKPYEERCFLFEDNFINLDLILDRLGIKYLTGILFDLGVSYFQLTTAKRGFSFDRKGILSMNMSSKTPSLRQKLEHTSRSALIAILKEYGDVRSYRRIGSEIYENRKKMITTYDLRQLVENVTPKRFLHKELHKVFQALRIWVNNELENLKRGLAVAIERLEPKGRIVVISYHSGEDRIVKNTFRQMDKEGQIILLHKKVIKPNEDEIKANPRARSAKLRVGERCVLS